MHAHNHTRVLERDYGDERELVLKAAKSGVKGKSVRILWVYFNEAIEDCKVFAFKEIKSYCAAYRRLRIWKGKKKGNSFEMLSQECLLWSCAEKSILECLCSWENSTQMWQQTLWCSSPSYKTLPWGSTTWVGMNGTKVHFNQWNCADVLWFKQRNLGLYWCLQGWPWGSTVPGEQMRYTWLSMACVARVVTEAEWKHARL